MQTNVFSLIEELISMSGSTRDFDSLCSELSILETDISKIKKELEELTSSMTEDKYFDASQEIVDRNIELSVSKKLNKLEKEFDVLQQKQADLQTKEQGLIEAVDSLKQKIINAKKTITMISDRKENSNEEKTKDIYSSVLEEENNKVEELQEKLEEKNNMLEKLSSEVGSVNEVVDKTKEEIEDSTARLMEVRKNLNNRKCYIDKNLKRKDNEALDSLKNKLSVLEEKKLNILTDANYIASEIKDLFVAEENDEALKKLLELVTIVNTKPYMEISDVTRLEEELAKLEKQQTELINAIENKEYFGCDVKYLDNRINHLLELVNSKKGKIERIKVEIENIDNNLVLNIANELKMAEKEANELENSIEDYHELIQNGDKKSTNTLIALQASYNKKNNELKVINNIIERYSNELSRLIETSAKLETEDILKIEASIKENENEIEELNKIKLLSTKTKDAIEQENDKNTLKELSNNIKVLKQRIRFEKTPQEIYDQIEMILSSKETSVSQPHLEENTKIIEPNIVIKPKDEENKISESPVFTRPENIEESPSLQNENKTQANDVKDFNLMNFSEYINENPVLEKTLIDELNDFEISDHEENGKVSTASKENLATENNEVNSSKNEDAEYTFSEIEDTNYFSLDEFLKKLDSQKEE